jgi:hypothetical protein
LTVFRTNCYGKYIFYGILDKNGIEIIIKIRFLGQYAGGEAVQLCSPRRPHKGEHLIIIIRIPMDPDSFGKLDPD